MLGVLLLTDDEAQEIAHRVLEPVLRTSGFDHVKVQSGLDHEGDPALFVEVALKPGSPELDGHTFSRAHGEIDNSFRAQHETRMSYLRVIWPDEPIEEFDIAS